MAKAKTPNMQPIKYDAALAEAAFEKLKHEMDALSAERVVVSRANMELGIGNLMKTLDLMQRLGLPSMLARLPAPFYTPGTFDRVAPLGWATWHAYRKARIARAVDDERAVPPGLIAEATLLEERMQECCEYMLGKHAEAGPIVAHLRAGGGHRDLAHDLIGYADLYVDYVDVISRDGKNYDPTDIPLARRYGAEILEKLAGTEDDNWADMRNRSWTLLSDAYEDVASLGRALLRKHPEGHFPTMYGLCRVPGRGKKARADGNPVDAPVVAVEPDPGGIPAEG